MVCDYQDGNESQGDSKRHQRAVGEERDRLERMIGDGILSVCSSGSPQSCCASQRAGTLDVCRTSTMKMKRMEEVHVESLIEVAEEDRESSRVRFFHCSFFICPSLVLLFFCFLVLCPCCFSCSSLCLCLCWFFLALFFVLVVYFSPSQKKEDGEGNRKVRAKKQKKNILALIGVAT